MSDQLMEEGWLAPAAPGPRRHHVAIAVGLAIVALGTWALLLHSHALGFGGGDERYAITITPAASGSIELAQAEDSRRTPAPVEMRADVVTTGDTRFVLLRGSISPVTHGDLDTELRLPAGVDEERVATRVERPGTSTDTAHVSVVVPASLLPDAKLGEPVGTVASETRDSDERIGRQRDDARRLQTLRDRWWLVALLGLGVSAALPLLLWRRARRAFFSMRRPGPGKDIDGAPPSSLDPVGAAVLVAGARPVDAPSAFAGHVLDLVERKQLLAKRTMAMDPGAGLLIGLGHAEEVDDVAVDVLRAIAIDDGMTAPVPDSRTKLRRAPDAERDAWYLHVAARERFEGMVDRVDPRRLGAIAMVLGILAVGALVAGVASDLAGRRAQLWLLAAVALPACVAVTLWAVDAGRWRIVTRARRLERAQWLAWRAAVGTPDGPALDQRSLPVFAATGLGEAGIRTFAGPDAVALDAVTAKTIVRLRSIVADD